MFLSRKIVNGGSTSPFAARNKSINMMRSESQEKRVEQIKKKQATQKQIQQKTKKVMNGFGAILGDTHTTQCFHLNLKQSMSQGEPPVWDPCWIYNIPVITPAQRTLMVQFQAASIQTVQTAVTDLPQEYYIKCNDIDGVLDKYGNATHILAILQIPAGGIIPFEHQGVTYYTVNYKLVKEKMWNIGTLRYLDFYLARQDGTIVATPYPFNLSVDLKIIHIAN